MNDPFRISPVQALSAVGAGVVVAAASVFVLLGAVLVYGTAALARAAYRAARSAGAL
jgi:hypothetical protein